MKHEHFGMCCTCREWTLREGDERHGEVLPGEHPLANSMGDCAIDGDVWIGCDTCGEYAKKEKP